jgi:hypothetical protein
VRFADGVEKEFWDIQLSEVRNSEPDQLESIRDEKHLHPQRAKNCVVIGEKEHVGVSRSRKQRIAEPFIWRK